MGAPKTDDDDWSTLADGAVDREDAKTCDLEEVAGGWDGREGLVRGLDVSRITGNAPSAPKSRCLDTVGVATFPRETIGPSFTGTFGDGCDFWGRAKEWDPLFHGIFT